jgi:hypothetical protein
VIFLEPGKISVVRITMQIPDLALSERRGQNITERNNTHINRRLNRYENLAMSCGTESGFWYVPEQNSILFLNGMLRLPSNTKMKISKNEHQIS